MGVSIKGNCCKRSLTRRKDEAIFQAYIAVIKSYGKHARLILKSAMYEEAANSPAPSFFINWRWVRDVVEKVNKGKRVTEKGKAIYQAYLDVRAKHGSYAKMLTKTALYEEAANSPAPSFFISTAHAVRVINNKLKETNREFADLIRELDAEEERNMQAIRDKEKREAMGVV